MGELSCTFVMYTNHLSFHLKKLTFQLNDWSFFVAMIELLAFPAGFSFVAPFFNNWFNMIALNLFQMTFSLSFFPPSATHDRNSSNHFDLL